ncbi:MAG: hypothetical protein IJ418_08095 [Clostridia bacterium]|nr:hypothetical protein [Clostridia bacterium]
MNDIEHARKLGLIIEAGARISWGGPRKMAAVGLWGDAFYTSLIEGLPAGAVSNGLGAAHMRLIAGIAIVFWFGPCKGGRAGDQG